VAIIQKAHEALRVRGQLFLTVPLARQTTDVRHYSPDALFLAVQNGGFDQDKIDIFEVYPDKAKREWGVAQLVCKATK